MLMSLSSRLKEYIDFDNQSIKNSDNLSYESFYYNYLTTNILHEIFNCELKDIVMLGGGISGFVIKFTSNIMKDGFDKLEKTLNNSNRIFKSTLMHHILPSSLSIKIQIFTIDNEDKILKEEFNIKQMNDSNREITKYIPKFYYGYTFVNNEQGVGNFRLTFMEPIDTTYYTLDRLIKEYKHDIPDILYTNIEILVKKLWKLGITHNDLSIRNILIDTSNLSGNYNIKLIDFRLSELLSPELQNNNTMKEYYKHLYTIVNYEQPISNIVKLGKLIEDFDEHNKKLLLRRHIITGRGVLFDGDNYLTENPPRPARF